MVELGRSCVHAKHRHGGVIMALERLGGFMVHRSADTMVGCAAFPMLHNGMVCGNAAASIWQLRMKPICPMREYQVFPRLALPVERLDASLDIRHRLLSGLLPAPGRARAGAHQPGILISILQTYMLMRLADLPLRCRRRHLLGMGYWHHCDEQHLCHRSCRNRHSTLRDRLMSSLLVPMSPDFSEINVNASHGTASSKEAAVAGVQAARDQHVSDTALPGITPGLTAPGLSDFLNRDHCILAFNERVFDWAARADVPLLERLRYLSIVSSNLDEFFEVRAEPHITAVRNGETKGPYGAASLAALAAKAHDLVARQYALYNDVLVSRPGGKRHPHRCAW